MIVNIANEAHFNEVISTHNLILADFYADWCEPCKWLDKILIDLAPLLQNAAEIIKIDTEKLTDLRQQNLINNVPVLILYKEGIEVWRINGFLTTNQLLEKVMEFSRGT